MTINMTLERPGFRGNLNPTPLNLLLTALALKGFDQKSVLQKRKSCEIFDHKASVVLYFLKAKRRERP